MSIHTSMHMSTHMSMHTSIAHIFAQVYTQVYTHVSTQIEQQSYGFDAENMPIHMSKHTFEHMRLAVRVHVSARFEHRV